MGRECIVPVCPAATVSGMGPRSLHNFPPDEATRQKWLDAIGIKKVSIIRPVVCSMHFKEEDFEGYLGDENHRLLKPSLVKGSVPSLFLSLENEGPTIVTLKKRVIELDTLPSPCKSPRLEDEVSFSEMDTNCIDEDQPNVENDNDVNELPGEGLNEVQLLVEPTSKNYFAIAKQLKALQVKHSQLKNSFKKAKSTIVNLRKANKNLRQKCKKLRYDRRVEVPLKTDNKIKEALTARFTEAQVGLMFKPKLKRVKQWPEEDIVKALVLRTSSRKCYNQLRKQAGNIIPCERSLGKYVNQFTVSTGIQKRACQILKEKIAKLIETDPSANLGVITFDEISLRQKYEYDIKQDIIVGPAKKAMVAMVRGLTSNWKQPIYLAFDEQMTLSIMDTIIRECERNGIEIHACVFDMGNPTFMKEIGFKYIEDEVEEEEEVDPTIFDLEMADSSNKPLEEVNLSVDREHLMPDGNGVVTLNAEQDDDQPLYFKNPWENQRKVFCFPDVPHIIKLLRNHLLKGGYWLPNISPYDSREVTITDHNGNVHVYSQSSRFTKRDMEQLVIKDGKEKKMLFKIKAHHLDVRGSAKQKVVTAAQLLSGTVAKKMDMDFPWKRKAARFISSCNNFLDVMNSRKKYGKNQLVCGFAVNYDEQVRALREAKKVIMSARTYLWDDSLHNFKLRNWALNCQKAVGHVVNNVIAMHAYLKREKKIKYLLTARLNQDCNENYFTLIRYISHSSPSAKEFLDRVRLLELGANPAFIVKNPCVEEQVIDDSETLTETGPTVVSEVNCDFTKNQSQIDNDTDTSIASQNESEYNKYVTIQEAVRKKEKESKAKPQKKDKPTTKQQHSEISKEVEFGENQGLGYIAGYLVHKFYFKYSNLGQTTSDYYDENMGLSVRDQTPWVSKASLGGLKKPSDEFFSQVKAMEEIFVKFNKDTENNDRVFMEDCVLKSLKDKICREVSEVKDLPHEVISLFCKTRLHIRLKYLNDQLTEKCQN